jgi:HEAT repeat protein
MLGGASPRAQQNPTLADLLGRFRTTTVFGRQFEVAREIAKMGDVRVLGELEAWLNHDDRHLRGNAAFVFTSLGDPRGFETLRTILTDRSERPLGQGLARAPGNMATPTWWLSPQVQAGLVLSDRYYAVHLFGELKSQQAVDVLLPLLDDGDINYKVAWALGEIGDRRAIQPLIGALKNPDAHVRVSAIHALGQLHATEALPHLRALLHDQAVPNAGVRVPVAATAKAVIAKLGTKP